MLQKLACSGWMAGHWKTQHPAGKLLHMPESCIVASTNEMTANAVKNLGKTSSRQIDWEAVALALGHLERAEYLADVCKNTMWRKKPGRKATRVIEFTATGRDSGGKPIEALGSRKNL